MIENARCCAPVARFATSADVHSPARAGSGGRRGVGRQGGCVRLRQRDHRKLDELVLLDPVPERGEPVGDLRLRVVTGEVDGGDEEDPPRPDELEVQEGDPLDLVTAAWRSSNVLPASSSGRTAWPTR